MKTKIRTIDINAKKRRQNKTEATNKQKSDALFYKTTKQENGYIYDVEIRLDDENKNGHQDFSITGTVYAGSRSERNILHCGCIHEDILKYFPEFKKFVALHLADFSGTPMFVCANAYYRLKNKFEGYYGNENFEEKFCDIYRVTPEQLQILKTSRCKEELALLITEMGIRRQWKQQADEAIKQLESLTGKEFVVNSERTQWDVTDEQINEFIKLRDSGYYDAAAIEQRKQEAEQKVLNDEIDRLKEKIASLCLEIEIKKAVFDAGGSKALEASIFYSHNNTVKLNWQNNRSGNLSKGELAEVALKIKLPAGISLDIND